MSVISNPGSLCDAHVLNLFNLKPESVDSIHILHDKDGVKASITLMRETQCCPVCQFETNQVKDYSTKKILHALTTNIPCHILYRARRYKCPACGKCFYEHNPFSHRNMKVSVLTVSNVLQDLKKETETFTSVANRYSLSPTSVSSIFDSHVYVSRRTLPKFINIDEVYGFSGHQGDYVCVLVDYITNHTIDVLPSRKKDDLIKYFQSIPRSERENVQIVSCDMWHTYRLVVKHCLPNSVVAVDRFHIIQEFHRKITSIRIQAMRKAKKLENSQDENKDMYYVFKKFNWLLLINDETIHKKSNLPYLDVNMEKQYNRKLKRYCNYYDLYQMMLAFDSQLETCINLKFQLDELYNSGTYESAPTLVQELINDLNESQIPEMIAFANTLRNWKSEVINSLIEIDDKKDYERKKWNDKEKVIQTQKAKRGKKYKLRPFNESKVYRMNNGIVENRNKVIKRIKNNSNGYSNWERFRHRVLYVLNDDATYRLNPINDKEKTGK